MSEIATSILNKNSLIYSKKNNKKDEGPACVDGKGKSVPPSLNKPAQTPIKAVREK